MSIIVNIYEINTTLISKITEKIIHIVNETLYS